MRSTPPYSQQFRFHVKPEFSGMSVIDFFCKRFQFRDRTYWLSLIEERQITVNHQGIDPDHIIHEGDLIHTTRHDVTEPDVNDDIEVIFEGRGILVVNKPAPLPVHPSGRYFKNTLTTILKERREEETFHTIHRLDTWTTGVLILGTEREAARFVHLQMEKQKLGKAYGVLAVGEFGDEPFFIDEAIGRLDGPHRGFGEGLFDAKESRTWFAPLAKSGDVTFLKAVPITGRTNQIRVHVNAAGGHVLNDPLYSPEKPEIPPFMGLHCRSMSCILPGDSEAKIFKATWPKPYEDFFSENDFARFDELSFEI